MEKNIEFEIKELKELLKELGLDAIYMKQQSNFRWLVGGRNYVSRANLGSCGLLITASHCYAITDNIEATRLREEEGIEEFGFELLIGDWYDGNFETYTLRKFGRKIAFDYDTPLGLNISQRIQELRWQLSEYEVEAYRTGGKIVSTILEEVAASSQSGERENQVAARLYQAAISANLSVVSCLCAGDERILQFRHALTTDRPIQKRLQLGVNLEYKNVTIGCTRFVNFEPISAQLQQQYLDNVAIDLEFACHTQVGHPVSEAFLAGCAKYDALGYPDEYKKHHQGGAIGFEPREYKVTANSSQVVCNPQAFCWNPTIEGTKSEDTLLVTDQEVTYVTYPVIFPRLEIKCGDKTFIRANILEKHPKLDEYV